MISQDPKQRPKVFWSQFEEETGNWNRDLEAAEKPLKPETVKSLADALAAIQTLANSATSFLPPYDVRKAQKTLEAAQGKLAAAKPAKAFGFRNKSRLAAKGTTTSIPTTTPDQPSVDHSSSKPDEQPIDPNYSFTNVTGGNPLVKAPGSVTGHDFVLADLSDVTVYVPDVTTALRVDRLTNCTVLLGPIRGSIHAQHCVNTRFVLAARQLRLHHSKDCTFYLAVGSHPIIEHCTGLKFAPLIPSITLPYPQALEQFKEAELSSMVAEDNSTPPEANMWNKVQDFRWIKATASPHWSEIPAGEREVFSPPE